MAAEDVLDSVKRLEDQLIRATRFEGISRAISLIGLAIIGIGAPLAIAAYSMQMTGGDRSGRDGREV